MCATSLAHYGLLGSVENMILRNLNLRGTPTKHMASLVSCVTHSLNIDKVHNCDLVSILTSLECEKLSINSQSLGTEETEAMVRAMEGGVERVDLGYLGDGITTLDIRAFTSYNGAGKCSRVDCHGDKAGRYKKDLMTWAQRNNWNVTVDSYNLLVIVKEIL